MNAPLQPPTLVAVPAGAPASRLSQGARPSTFLERGAAVPFTTPELAGARARPGNRKRLELIVPNPSGARGVYVLPWEGVKELCRPTVHDCRLNDAVAALVGVNPQGIRAAAHAIAAEGLAGREAAAAAEQASKVDDNSRLLTNFDLLLELVRQIEAPGENRALPERDQICDMETRAKEAVARIAPSLGRRAEQVATSLEELASLFSSVGISRNAAAARVPRQITGLVQLREAMIAWAERHPDNGGPEASLVGAVAELTLGCVRAVLLDVRRLTGDMARLLARWHTNADAVAEVVARPDWLLDGWDRIALLWRTIEAAGPDAMHESTLIEMAGLLPMIPKEAEGWVGKSVNIEFGQTLTRRKVSLMQDWRSGATLGDLVARNEELLAMAQ